MACLDEGLHGVEHVLPCNGARLIDDVEDLPMEPGEALLTEHVIDMLRNDLIGMLQPIPERRLLCAILPFPLCLLLQDVERLSSASVIDTILAQERDMHAACSVRSICPYQCSRFSIHQRSV